MRGFAKWDKRVTVVEEQCFRRARGNEGAKMNLDLTKSSAYTDKTPYEIWQETEGVPIYQGLAIDDLRTVTLEPWNRKGVLGAFINLLGSGRSCDSYACEIPPKGHTLPERYLFEELIYVVKGRGATSVWTE